MSNSPLGLYIHIPWCPSRCIYCDFNTYVEQDNGLKARYHTTLLQEIRQTAAALHHPTLTTIFLGGGTPTTLAPAQLLEIIQTVQAEFPLDPSAEITTEANPGTLSLEYLQTIWQGGIKRLSLGVQSFQPHELTFLSRLHDVEAVYRTVEQARQAGFNNLSLDLIFNLPYQTLAQWEFNLQAAMALQPDHLSLYSLIVETGTPLHRQVHGGLVPTLDDDLAADMYALATEQLAGAGYAQYEISNWARLTPDLATWQTPPLAAQHNLIYWRNQPYIGVGAGAFGTLNNETLPPELAVADMLKVRWGNVKQPQMYIKRIEAGQGVGAARDEATLETIDQATSMFEQMMLGLRLTREGVSAGEFYRRFGHELAVYYAQAIEAGLERGLLEWLELPTDRRLRLTYEGRFLANQVMVEFME